MADVLIVEDADLQQAMIARFVQSTHTVVGVATTERDAVALAKEHDPDIAIVDINLDDGDGISVAKQIKSFAPDTKIIISTAHVNDEIKKQAQMIPAEEYMVKPYSQQELLNAINRTR